MDILFASSNEHKKTELEALLKPHRIHLPSEFGISFDCPEDGKTFAANAMQKAEALLRQAAGAGIKMPVLADDSGLLVDALPGELGVRTARFGSRNGEPVLPAPEKNKLLLERLKGLSEEQRTARFVCSLVLVDTDGTCITAEGTAPGYILKQPAGKNGFGYDPVFFCLEAGRPMAELAAEEKNKYSHRAKASALLLEKAARLHAAGLA